MHDTTMTSAVRAHRTALKLTQSELAARVGASRQALSAIEAGRQVPSTLLALHLARALDCTVDDLFRIPGGKVVEVRCALGGPDVRRVAVGRVQDTWVAHPLDDLAHAADGLIVRPGSSHDSSIVEVLDDSADLAANVLVAGCAPLLGVHADRLGRRYRDARATWIHANSSKALRLLADGLVHIAGVHMAASDDPEAHERAARRAVPGERSVLVNLARWRQGLVVARGNPLDIRVGADLLRPGLRFAMRDAGAAAQHLLDRELRSACGGREANVTTRAHASNHAEVAALVHWNVVDVGVAIESAALDHGLDFIPLSEERFDLVLPESLIDHEPVARFLGVIDEPAFRAEVGGLPGYDLSLAGHASTVELA
ncbi:MAG: substrate-binding domain-containing protein [Longimicrobiales bacterium]